MCFVGQVLSLPVELIFPGALSLPEEVPDDVE